MRLSGNIFIIACGLQLTGAVHAQSLAGPPVALVHRYTLSQNVKGHFDHFGVDAAGKRLFATAVEGQRVLVFDFDTGRMIKEIQGVKEPRGVVYRSDLARLYVSDGGGAMRVFDSNTFVPVKSFKIAVDADPVAYDPGTQRLFVVNGGEKAHHTYSNVTVFDTGALAQVGEIHLDGIEVEGMTVESGGPRVFANNRDKNEVDIFDRKDLHQIAIWPVRLVKRNTVSVLDEATHRLFIAGHEGQLDVLDSDSGKELQTLSIGMGADDIAFDPQTRRIYIASGGGPGAIDVLEEIDADHYRSLGRVTTEPGAATARLVPELGKYVVMVPAGKITPAQILVYSVAPGR